MVFCFALAFLAQGFCSTFLACIAILGIRRVHDVCARLQNLEEISPAIDFPSFGDVGGYRKIVVVWIFGAANIHFFSLCF